ncbi:bifunctional chorismate mutase/prephenate dehydratase [Eubacterium oxidoreducens]|uniref:Bifunctional chorismate mutase/prephenate dehydratase n=1 Tax=Eubacterium oxidoreducens TaxID=1732 RepID=A0A1G6APL2_EUBOX|nr:bifunctional chorismate mutase/prephenate dehydratase [Eubacterium oxidoreducens]SDB10113.1 chorismate mutase / prephenate dehydratase [Eubacterium oxidoreducens]
MDLEEIRRQIDETDDQLVKLYCHRMKLSEQVASYKIDASMEVQDHAREETKMKQVCSAAASDFENEAIKELYEQIMSISRKRQYQLIREKKGVYDLGFQKIDELGIHGKTIVFQGTDGAYSQVAMNAFFHEPDNSYHVETWRDAMEALKSGEADYAVLPIENTTAGDISENYDLMTEYGHHIVGEMLIPIRHALLGLPGSKISDIKEVVSHPQALSQCSIFLNSNRQMKQVKVENTAVAAMRVKDSGDITKASIGNRLNADIYNLEILSEDIINVDTNATLFIIVSKDEVYTKDADKVTISFELPNKSGSLYYMLSHFIYNGLNLTKISSRPIPGRNFEYRFFVEVDGTLEDDAMANALIGLLTEAGNVQILGCYKMHKQTE